MYRRVVEDMDAHGVHLPEGEESVSLQGCWRRVGAHKFNAYSPDNPLMAERMCGAIRAHLQTVMGLQPMQMDMAPPPPPPLPEGQQQLEEENQGRPAKRARRRHRFADRQWRRRQQQQQDQGQATATMIVLGDDHLRDDDIDLASAVLRAAVSIPIIPVGSSGGGAAAPRPGASPEFDRVLSGIVGRRFDVKMAVSDALTADDIERLFVSRGLGHSGKSPKTCKICLERKDKFIRFSRDCEHDACADCSYAWMKANTLADGARCPGCMYEKASSPSYADPTVMLGKKLGDSYDSIAFASFQIPKLQQALDAMVPSSNAAGAFAPPPVGRCPSCSTVSSGGANCLRQCPNPRCAVTFCLRCDGIIDGDKALKQRHLDAGCATLVAETREIASGEGLSHCTKCGTALWHAVGHGCHHVKCITCGHEQCHACGRPYKHPDCKCPLFCRPDFACRCAKTCPECDAGPKPCTHCTGHCPSCAARRDLSSAK
jgi:hypothetical protein